MDHSSNVDAFATRIHDLHRRRLTEVPGRGPELAPTCIDLHAQNREEPIAARGNEIRHCAIRRDAHDLRLVHAPDEERACLRIESDVLGNEVLRQKKCRRTAHQRRRARAHPRFQSSESRVVAQRPPGFVTRIETDAEVDGHLKLGECLSRFARTRQCSGRIHARRRRPRKKQRHPRVQLRRFRVSARVVRNPGSLCNFKRLILRRGNGGQQQRQYD